jgi:hypothetical protein
VISRRSLAIRQRLIYCAKADSLSDDKCTFRLALETEAGTYVKEFVHGDFGRTRPSLSSVIGDCETDIIELDVTVRRLFRSRSIDFLHYSLIRNSCYQSIRLVSPVFITTLRTFAWIGRPNSTERNDPVWSSSRFVYS